LLLRDGIDFDDDAVDFVRKRVALGLPEEAEFEDFVRGGREAAVGVDAEAELGEGVELLGLGGECGLAVAEEEVGVEVEAAGGGDAGVEDAEGSGGGVAGVGEGGIAGGFAGGVEGLKIGAVHDDFATNLEGFGLGRGQGYGADGAGVGGDVFAGRSVAAGEGLEELTVFVSQGEGEAVEFEFAVVEGLFGGEEFGDAAVEVAEFAFMEGVVEAEHRGGMGRLEEALAGLAADALGGGIGGTEVGVGVFEVEELAEELVVGGVGDFGLIEDVIEVFVAADQGAQRQDFVLGIHAL
jgi:hypothetical protein